ncbi:Holliday junction resolvase RuvX [Mycoplasmopsis gallinacea]|uniref:Putative pre-16S rRNA nuclease n=1 Tax=Mycoplasmopsis gallinacea TaxID=29556 RepID=A0A449A299_9BACT|nr:Holliday junction resolvase RuvX [Mycoplasmopsis gallinacea]VEU58385.1 Putative Holliday junction resolvase [Mycoplasmopsis gallinacea]
MRVLGIDLGTKTCGFAITDESEIIASGLENFIFPKENDFNSAIDKIKEYLKTYKIGGFVLGYPLKISGEKSQRTLMVEDFCKMLLENFDLPIMYVNEQKSTIRAEEVMINAGMTRQKRKQHKDKLAAVIILQDYLDYYRGKWDEYSIRNS